MSNQTDTLEKTQINNPEDSKLPLKDRLQKKLKNDPLRVGPINETPENPPEHFLRAKNKLVGTDLKFVRKLGTGAMGIAYLVKDEGPLKVLKVVRDDFLGKDATENINLERDILWELQNLPDKWKSDLPTRVYQGANGIILEELAHGVSGMDVKNLPLYDALEVANDTLGLMVAMSHLSSPKWILDLQIQDLVLSRSPDGKCKTKILDLGVPGYFSKDLENPLIDGRGQINYHNSYSQVVKLISYVMQMNSGFVNSREFYTAAASEASGFKHVPRTLLALGVIAQGNDALKEQPTLHDIKRYFKIAQMALEDNIVVSAICLNNDIKRLDTIDTDDLEASKRAFYTALIEKSAIEDSLAVLTPAEISTLQPILERAHQTIPTRDFNYFIAQKLLMNGDLSQALQWSDKALISEGGPKSQMLNQLIKVAQSNHLITQQVIETVLGAINELNKDPQKAIDSLISKFTPDELQQLGLWLIHQQIAIARDIQVYGPTAKAEEIERMKANARKVIGPTCDIIFDQLGLKDREQQLEKEKELRITIESVEKRCNQILAKPNLLGIQALVESKHFKIIEDAINQSGNKSKIDELIANVKDQQSAPIPPSLLYGRNIINLSGALDYLRDGQIRTGLERYNTRDESAKQFDDITKPIFDYVQEHADNLGGSQLSHSQDPVLQEMINTALEYLGNDREGNNIGIFDRTVKIGIRFRRLCDRMGEREGTQFVRTNKGLMAIYNAIAMRFERLLTEA